MTTNIKSKIPLFSGKRSFKLHWEEISTLLDSVIDKGDFINGNMVREFEKDICAYTNASYAIAVNNATDALHIILKAAGIGPGDEVIVPCYTFFASASSIANVGAKPVFIDIGSEDYNIDVKQIESKITPNTKAIIPVHLFTHMANMKVIKEIADKYGLLILEDSAEGIGMWKEGIHAGLHGKAGVISFFPTKTLGTIGDSGMIITNEEEFANECYRLRNHGQDPNEKYIHKVIGYNSKMDDIQAAVLRVRLKYLSKDIERRAHLAQKYDSLLSDLSSKVKIKKELQKAYSSNIVYYVYLIEVEQRDELVDYLSNKGIETEVYYPRPLHLQPCFNYLGYQRGDFPVAEKASSKALALPLYPDMTDEEVEYVSLTIKEFYS